MVVLFSLNLKQNTELWSNALISLFSLNMSSTLRYAIQYARTEVCALQVFANAERCTKGSTVRQEVSSIFSQVNFVFCIIVDASGSFSFLMFVFMIGLVIAGILILWQRDKFRDEIREYQERIRNSANSLGSKNNQPNKFNNADGRPISPR